ncbi:MAG: hypothetical protein GXO77_09700 [Calditrichaeota bacterium]|nr:hypothetical protein [Calditrichota bacterium]
MRENKDLLWVEEFKVRAYEAGPDGRASVQTIFDYLQESASNHAAALKVAKTDLDRLGMTWVVSRVHIRMEKYPFWNEIVRVETWPSQKDTLFALRDFVILDQKGNQIGVATTSWMLIDFKIRKPVRLPSFLDEMVNTDRGRALNDPFDRLPEPEKIEHEVGFKVRLSDLDMNRHVNSVNYIDWALEAVPAEVWNKFSIKEIEVNYRAESFYGDRVLSQAQVIEEGEGMIVRHRLQREKDGRELCRIVSRWRPVQS